MNKHTDTHQQAPRATDDQLSRGTPDGLEAAAVAHHHRRSGGTQPRVLEIDSETRTVLLGNFPGLRVKYTWSERRDCNGFRFVEVEDEVEVDILDQTIDYLARHGYRGEVDGGRIVIELSEADDAETDEQAETEAEADVNNIEQLLLWEGAPEVSLRVTWEKSDSYVAIVEEI